jgi:D-alanyl-D-alanine carboxypeptidase
VIVSRRPARAEPLPSENHHASPHPAPTRPPGGNRYGLGLEEVVTPCGTVWGHVGQVPGYSSENYADSTGRRTVAVLTATVFGLADPAAGAADRAVVTAAVCTMLGKPVPATPTP